MSKPKTPEQAAHSAYSAIYNGLRNLGYSFEEAHESPLAIHLRVHVAAALQAAATAEREACALHAEQAAQDAEEWEYQSHADGDLVAAALRKLAMALRGKKGDV